MGTAFVICIGYAFAGLLYAPGRDAAAALVFIAFSAAPLLLAARASMRLPALTHPPPGQVTFAALFGLGILNLILIAIGLDRSPAELLSPEGFVLAAAEATARRYLDEGSSGNPVLLALSLFLVYRVAAASGRVSRWQMLLAFMPMLLYTMLSTEKWPLFLAGVFYIFGLFASAREGVAFSRMLRMVLVFALAGGALASVALVLRGFDGDALDLPGQLLHYILAPFPAFGNWLLDNSVDQCCSGGGLTFIGTANQLGLMRREAGVFAENYFIYGQETNIYSAWRYLTQDFSVVGPGLINLLMGIGYLVLHELRWSMPARALRGLLIAAALMSLAVTPFVHNSVALAITLALLYTAAVQSRTTARLAHSSHEQARTAGL